MTLDQAPTERLSRERVVDAALAYIDDHGAQKLSMRKLGAVLHVEGMALYRYVSGREDLLEGVVDRVMGGLVERLDTGPYESWQGYLQNLAHGVREVALEHPLVFPLVATRHPAAPWLRPPLRDLELVEHFLSTLIDHGFTASQAVATYQAYTSFLVGHLLLESAQHGADSSPVEVPFDEGGAGVPGGDAEVDVSQFRTIQSLRDLLSRDSSEEQFEVALETLLDRLELSLSQ